jgi:hypothetical protein
MEGNMKMINVAKDFSRYPSGRHPEDSKYSGERFREDFLVQPLRENSSLMIELDGTLGYGSSFLDEAFGGLSRIHGFTKEFLKNHLHLISKNEDLVTEAWSYMH